MFGNGVWIGTTAHCHTALILKVHLRVRTECYVEEAGSAMQATALPPFGGVAAR